MAYALRPSPEVHFRVQAYSVLHCEARLREQIHFCQTYRVMFLVVRYKMFGTYTCVLPKVHLREVMF